MADILPFRALRYNLNKVSASDVLTQPYDKITPAMQERYYEASPYNLVRVILGKSEAGDGEAENVYSRASASLKQWQAEGVLEQDAEPSIYVYSQTFRVPGDPSGAEIERRGFIALGRVDDYDNKVVFRHEQTLSKPKADRLNLVRATDAHCELIFMVYDDPTDEVGKALVQEGPPTLELRDEYGVAHRMWKVSDPATVAAAKAKMSDKKLIIADGHHRYETALNFRNEMRAKHGSNDAEATYERVMIAFVNMDAPGLVILPTHRVVFGLENFNIFAKAAKVMQYFDIQDIGAVTDVQDAMRRLREAGSDRTALLAVTAQNAFLLCGRDNSHVAALQGLSEQQRKLDVVQLHKLILEEIIGMSEEDIRAQKHLKYIRGAEEAINDVRSGAAQIAFLMNPVRMEQVRDIAFAGQVLPQKSTDFYPKMLSGLTIYSLVHEAAAGEKSKSEVSASV
jgi:uncharacterized protein (DUF1015 family)